MKVDGVSDTRRSRLNELLQQQFGGNIQALADKIEKAHAQVWQWLNGSRNVSERTAAAIEQACSLPAGWLSGRAQPGGAISEVIDALPPAQRSEIVDFLMFKVQQAGRDVLTPEKFQAYMEMLSRFRGGRQ